MVGLDSTSSHFFEDLDSLDRLGSRSHDTVYVFYVRSGQKDSYEILSNMVNKKIHVLYCFVHLGNAIVNSIFFYFVLLNLNFSIIQSLASSLNPHFLEFLQALGWPQGNIF